MQKKKKKKAENGEVLQLKDIDGLFLFKDDKCTTKSLTELKEITCSNYPLETYLNLSPASA